jgi:uncharacterized repeat protein (TIGR01451 family)
MLGAPIVWLAVPGVAQAGEGTKWTVTAFSSPTVFAPNAGSTGTYRIQVQNTGEAPSDGSTITVTDVLPTGLKPVGNASGEDWISGQEIACTGTTCTYAGVVPVDDFLEMTIPVEVEANQSETVTDEVTAVGGGAPEAGRQIPTMLGSAQAAFGFAPGSTAVALSNDQAGAHPDLTTSLVFTKGSNNLLGGDPREVVSELPPGFVGDIADTPRCQLSAFSSENSLVAPAPCPLGSQVGTTTFNLSFGPFTQRVTAPVYNLSTNPGEIAKLGFFALFFGVQGTVSLRPGDYGITTTFQSINDSIVEFEGVSLTIWGVPSAKSHDVMRGLVCAGSQGGSGTSCLYANDVSVVPRSELPNGQSSGSALTPYLTSPTECAGEPLGVRLKARSWQQGGEGAAAPVVESMAIGSLTGCGLLEFAPEIVASPDTTRADSPAGLTFGVKMGQEGLVSPETLSTADIENTTVTLPEGVAVNPGQAAGLKACQFSEAALEVSEPPACPSGSKVGHVEVRTPILKNKLEGDVYLLQSNPPDLKLLVAPEDREDGIYVKFIGDVHLNTATGRLVTTFGKTPQLPFDDLKLSLSGGPQAALATPVHCGLYSTEAQFASWAMVDPGTEALSTASLPFSVDTGPGGSQTECGSTLPFAPSLVAGSTTDQAGAFTDFSMLLQRADGQQRVSALQFKAPPGLLAEISKVTLCGATEAGTGACSASSQIGYTVVESGPGPYPLVVPQPGQPPAPIYLTGPYNGAPYGLLIKVPLVVGPFTLPTQIVRARIDIDPRTSQVTITTDPLPKIIDGIPTDLRTINAVIDHPEFMFNPTNCSPMSFGGTATSAEEANAVITTRFQVGSCRSLGFQPRFTVVTSGRTSRMTGASLDAKIVYPKRAPEGDLVTSQANIESVKVSLPRQLSSRLSTLQKGCPDGVFDDNPSACPAASHIGRAKAVTPVLPSPLEGPAYFVSHGGQKFPELIVVLQGDGVTVDLHGETFISKKGITTSTFRQVPDVPIDSFELRLPSGPHSALAPAGSLCKAKGKLAMPTTFTAQNGLVIRRSTKISVTGCNRSKHSDRKGHG